MVDILQAHRNIYFQCPAVVVITLNVKKSEHDLAEYAARQLVTICSYCRREAPEVFSCAGFTGWHLLSDKA